MRPLARRDTQLFLASAAVLFAELFFIRWIPANVVYVGFFNNFLLLASFLGIGVGILLGRRWPEPPIPGSIGVAAVAALVAFAKIDVRAPSGEPLVLNAARPQIVVDAVVLAGIVGLVALAMALLAIPLGRLLRELPPLRAYAFDIAGSLAGIAAFAVLSLFATPPPAWIGVLLALLLARALGRPRRRVADALTLAGAALLLALLIVPTRGSGDVWSPYYRITPSSILGDTPALLVNGVPHQAMWRAVDPRKEVLYEQIYRWFPERWYDDVLVIGAGSGSDTTLALWYGASTVDAVEIDPLILDLGRKLHPDQPYSDERVSAYVDDGRAFLRRTDRRYDLVIFAQTDSLSLVTTTSNLRIDSFLFTKEAFSSVRDHLKDDGVFLLYNQYQRTFIADRIARGLEDTFGGPPLVSSYALGPDVNFAVFATGPGVASLGGGLPASGDAGYRMTPPDARPATDDWPFLYLEDAAIPPRFVAALAAVLVLSGLAVAGAAALTRGRRRGLSVHFFLLGVAFLLLETRSLVTFSLLFGTTWIVNALAFFAILVSVLIAIGVSARGPRLARRGLYAGLLVSLLVAYLVPPSALLVESALLRYGLASAIAFAPIFFANLVFADAFRDAEEADVSFASNLLGAMVGGVLEWTALIFGYQALLLIVIGVYAGAYVLRPRAAIGAPISAPR